MAEKRKNICGIAGAGAQSKAEASYQGAGKNAW